MNDLISRQAAIDALDGEITVTGMVNAEAVRDRTRGFDRCIELDFTSVSTGWTRFSKKTNPPFVKEMFTFDRKDQIIQFKEKLQNESGDIIVKAPTIIDSVGFALSVIAEEEERPYDPSLL